MIMKVKELKEVLEKFDPELEVVYRKDKYCSVAPVGTVEEAIYDKDVESVSYPEEYEEECSPNCVHMY